MTISWADVFIFSVIIISGFFGGVISFLLDSMHGEHSQESPCIKCSSLIIFCRGLVGVSGAATVVFLGVLVDKLKLSIGTNNTFILIGLSCLSGIASHRMLPKLGKKLEEQVLKDEIKKTSEEVKREVLSYSKQQNEVAIEHSTAMAQAREALELKNDNDMKLAIVRLRNVSVNFPTDRTLNIFLARLYRWTGDIDSAILVLRKYIEEIGKVSQAAPDKYLFDKSAALYNIACYHSVKASHLSSRGGPPEDINRLLGESTVALEECLDIWSKHANTAAEDDDFDALKKSPEHSDKFNRLVQGHQRGTRSREE